MGSSIPYIGVLSSINKEKASRSKQASTYLLAVFLLLTAVVMLPVSAPASLE